VLPVRKLLQLKMMRAMEMMARASATLMMEKRKKRNPKQRLLALNLLHSLK
jgi:hypothetical protein